MHKNAVRVDYSAVRNFFGLFLPQPSLSPVILRKRRGKNKNSIKKRNGLFKTQLPKKEKAPEVHPDGPFKI